MTTARRAVLTLALLLGVGVGCGSSQADRLCTIAESVVKDSSVAPEERGPEWFRRAHGAIDHPKIRAILEQAVKAGRVDREIFEAAISDAIGESWSCPALDEILGPSQP